jgi:4-hydroxy-3-methylbut-2-en-1-yl diphosphate synthase IspG/GcpE
MSSFGFRVGDWVKISGGSMLATSRPDLAHKVGSVKELVVDGTSLERITVDYDGSVEFVAIYAGVFDRHRAKLEVV